MKKGLVFSLEALIAIIIMTSLFAFLSVFNIENVSPYKRFERVQLYAKDSLEVMSQITVKDLIDQFPDKVPTLVPTLIQEMENGNIENESSIIEAIGTLWSEGYSEAARNISNETLSLILPKTLGYNLTANGDEIYYTSSPIVSASTEVSNSNKILSGFQPGKLTKGFVARAFLEKIKSKTFSSYLYFGGFVGQGNLTSIMYDIPDGAEISSIFIEMSLGSGVDFYVNGQFCKRIEKTTEVERTQITDPICIGSILPGQSNIFKLNFTTSDISKSFVSGGLIRVDYATDILSTPSENSLRYNFTGVEGLINTFDSFYVPGQLNTINAHLVFRSDFNTFLNIGNKTVISTSGSKDIQTVNVDNSTLSSILYYNELSNTNIPIRFGFNLPIITGTADVVLITDLSGSMDWRFDSSSSGVARNCDDSLLNNPSTKRISLAKCLDKTFVDTILGVSGNRVALVGYDGTGACIRSSTPLSSDASYLKSQINLYTASGSTCISCSINRAYNILSGADPTRQRFIVVMTDGLANTRPNVVNGFQPCSSASDGVYDSVCGDTISQSAATETVQASCRAHQDLNAIVHSIGFGPTATCKFSADMLRDVANCGVGIFAASNNPAELQKIYENIAKEILKQNYENQKITLSKDVNNMTISPESYIEVNFNPPTISPIFGGISITIETDTFPGCEGTFFVPDGFRVDRISVTSYSGEYWTNYVKYKDSPSGGWRGVFNLTDFGQDYTRLGDPFKIEIPASFVRSGSNNSVNVSTGSNPTKFNSACSQNNKVIYTATFSAITGFSPVLKNSTGNIFNVSFNKGDFDCEPEGYVNVTVGTPVDPTVVHSVEDLDTTNNAVHFAFSQLLDKLNFKGSSCPGDPGSATNPIDIEITPELKMETSEISNVPSLWGPIKFELTISS